MRFSRGEVVFHRLKIISKTLNVAEVNVEKVEGANERAVLPVDVSGPLPRRGL
ncbi:hypothetical protein E2C01_065779 [Portunus trituberculatus]|uniref:Uncharacterized protein n=1 Tax=Portunus trituberculatus TaxID=210409 RepID=A0A5B7HJT0_PORTR|nr:hypothetical protein [Portunus trituberculatus]